MHLFVRFLGFDLIDMVFGTDEPEPQLVSNSGLPVSERVLEVCDCDDCSTEQEDKRRIGF